MSDPKITVPALPPQPIPQDLVKEMAMDIGKEVAAYVERMFPKAVEAASSSFLLSIRNCTYNQIMAALETTDADAIATRLQRRKQERRKLRAMVKASRTVQPEEVEKAFDIINGNIPMEPDL